MVLQHHNITIAVMRLSERNRPTYPRPQRCLPLPQKGRKGPPLMNLLELGCSQSWRKNNLHLVCSRYLSSNGPQFLAKVQNDFGWFAGDGGGIGDVSCHVEPHAIREPVHHRNNPTIR